MPDDFDPFADPRRTAGPQPLAGPLGDLRAQMARERLEGPRRRRPVTSLVALGLTLLASAGIAWAGWHGLTQAVDSRAISLRTGGQVGTLALLVALAALVVAVVAVVREHPKVLAVLALVLALVLPWVALVAAVQAAVPYLQVDLAGLGVGSLEEWVRGLGEPGTADSALVWLLEVLTG